VGNPDDLQGWISAVHGPCDLVTSAWRPVPLSFYYAKRGSDERGGWPGLGPLLSRRGDRLNRALDEQVDEERDGSSRGPRMLSSWRRDAPSQESVVRHLVREDMLPAIWFIFSRARCDEAVACMASSSTLVTPEERARLSAALDRLRASCPEALRPEYAAPLLAGVAAHHAGCLPAWKSFVEELFQEGLLKVVFATETLAAGINMPARAVVLSSTSKRDAEGPRRLTVNEFMQMAGRAGRRGFDTQGSVVVVQSAFEGATSASELALGEPEARARLHASMHARVSRRMYSSC
jgi:superfamily II RNA helicase